MTSTKWWAVFLGIAIVEIILLAKLLTSEATVPLLIAIALVTILLILTLRIEDITELLISKGTFKAELVSKIRKVESRVNRVGSEIKEKVQYVEQRQVKTEKRQDEAQKLIKALSIALEGIVTKYERDHLEKLRPENDDTVSFGPNFFQEIERLDAIGLISPIKRDGIVAIQNEHGTPGQLFHLREYVKLTEKGENYLNVTVSFSREANTTLHNSLPS